MGRENLKLFNKPVVQRPVRNKLQCANTVVIFSMRRFGRVQNHTWVNTHIYSCAMVPGMFDTVMTGSRSAYWARPYHPARRTFLRLLFSARMSANNADFPLWFCACIRFLFGVGVCFFLAIFSDHCHPHKQVLFNHLTAYS